MGRVAGTKRKTNGLHKVSLVRACGRLRGELWCHLRLRLISRKGQDKRQVIWFGVDMWNRKSWGQGFGSRTEVRSVYIGRWRLLQLVLYGGSSGGRKTTVRTWAQRARATS